jgi:hypothetical protein
MSGTTIGLDELRTSIASTAPLELKGMGLLREQPRLITGVSTVPRGAFYDIYADADDAARFVIPGS